jgi:IS1 family transposase/transposase-like protein
LDKEGKMLDHSAPSILPFLLTVFCYLIITLPLLLIWLPELMQWRSSALQKTLPNGPTKAPYCPACEANEAETRSEHRDPPPRIKQQQGRPREVDTSNHYCPDENCCYYGWVDRGNIRANGHPNSGRWRQLECTVCSGFFMETTGTIFFGKPTLPKTIWRALKALAEGLGIRATARVFDVDPNTVEDWLCQAAEHMEAVSRYLLHDLQLSQIQIDELWALLGRRDPDESKGKRWVWVGTDPDSKLWLASMVGDRTQDCAQLLIHAIHHLLAPGCVPVFLSDQWSAYVSALLTHFGQWVSVPRRHRLGRPPKPRWRPLPDLHYAQLVKKREKGRVVSTSHRIIYGSLEKVEEILQGSGAGQVINTAFIERLNLTIRQHVAALARKVIHLAKTETGLDNQLKLSQGYYNFCLPHTALRLPLPEPQPTKGSGSAKKWQQRSPAVAANVTNQIWKLEELLLFRAPPWQQGLKVTS